MEVFNEVDEPLNSYFRFFILFWTGAMIVVVVGFRTGNKDDMTTKSSHVNARVEANTLSHGLKTLAASTPKLNHLAE